MTRDDAIAALRAAGLDARPRDWSFGETIAIPVGERRADDTVSAYDNVVYLYPRDDGGWNLLDLQRPDPAETYPDLDTALAGVRAYLGLPSA